jgi:hypothetical protein
MLMSNAYPGKLVDSVINGGKNRKGVDDKETESRCVINIPYIRGGSEKFKRNGIRFNLRTAFGTK